MVSCGWEKTGYFSPRWKQDSDSWSSSLLHSEQSPRTIGVTAPDNQLLYPLHLGAAINKRWPQRRKAGPSPPTDTRNPAKSTHPPKSQSTQWFGITLRAKQELERKAQPTRSWPRAAAAKPAEEHDPLQSWREKVAQPWKAAVTATGTRSVCPRPHHVPPLSEKLNLLSE